VLRAGGYEDGIEASTAVDLYDPARATWQSLPPLHRARVVPALVQARDGRVLVFGGIERGSTGDFEALDADLSTWREVVSPLGFSASAAARKAYGTIVLAGEKEAQVSHRHGSYATTIPVSAALELDAVTLAPTRRQESMAMRQLAMPRVLVGGEVAFVGGEVPGSGPWPNRFFDLIEWRKRRALRDVEWSTLGAPFDQSASAPRSFEMNRCDLAVEVAPRQLLVLGNRDGRMLAYQFDLLKNKVRGVASPRPHGFGAALMTLHDGSALLVGGDGALTQAECFDPGKATWTTLPDAPAAGRVRTGVVLKDGRALFVGESGRVDIYSPGVR
jgi:hypothetical protein